MLLEKTETEAKTGSLGKQKSSNELGENCEVKKCYMVDEFFRLAIFW